MRVEDRRQWGWENGEESGDVGDDRKEGVEQIFDNSHEIPKENLEKKRSVRVPLE